MFSMKNPQDVNRMKFFYQYMFFLASLMLEPHGSMNRTLDTI